MTVPSRQRSVASGSTDTFPVTFPYLDKSHVLVSLDGVLQAASTYTWPTEGTIQFNSGNIAAGVVVERKRQTPVEPLTVFEPGNLSSDDLNVAVVQPLYVAQEASDYAADIDGRDWKTVDYGAGGLIAKGPAGTVPQFDADGNLTGFVTGAGGFIPIGLALNMLRWNADATALENRTPAEVLDDIGALDATLVPSPVALSMLRWNAAAEALENRTAAQVWGDLGSIPEAQLPGRLKASPSLVTDLDTITSTGWYRHAPGATGEPISGYGFVEHLQFDAQSIQTWHQIGDNRKYKRTYNGTTWSAWTFIRTVDDGLNIRSLDYTTTLNPGEFGGSFLSATAANIFAVTKTATDAGFGPRAVTSIENVVVGGHGNGPGQARLGIWNLAYKTNYLTTTETGEIDAMYVQVRQGRKDDAGGILIDAVKVFDTGGDGGLTPMEGVGARVNESNTVLSRVRFILGFQEGAGGALNAEGAGVYVEAEIGSPTAGFAAVNTGGAFTHAYAAYLARDPAQRYYSVQYNGNVVVTLGSPADNMSVTFDYAADAMFWRDNTLANNLMSLTKSGQLSAFAGMRVANGSTLITKKLKQTASLNFGSIPAHDSLPLTVTVTGAAVGDHVSVCPDNTYVSNKLNFVGRVSSANTVTVECQNISAAAIDPAAQNVIILVTGG